MIIKSCSDSAGYHSITEMKSLHPHILLDFGLLKLDKGKEYISTESRERAYLLIRGRVQMEWDDKVVDVERNSCFDEGPTVLHVPEMMKVKLTGLSDQVELAVEKCFNETAFMTKLYLPGDCREDVFGHGTMQEASTRKVRTVFDGELAPWSNMVMGEVITYPGKWSSYPPHGHPHPEIYHYRFQPSQGFGVSLLDYEAHVVRDGDTCLIPPDLTHSQVAAAGYAMWYLWMIPHLPDNRWLPATRYFRKEHEWLLNPDARIWKDNS